MKILHILNFSTPAAGTFVVLKEIAAKMVDQGIECHILLLRNDRVGEQELNEIGAHVYFIDILNLVNIKRLTQCLPIIGQIDLIHIHGVYSYKMIMFSNLVRKLNTPYIISTHGSFMSRGIESKSKIKKKIVLKTILSKYIKNAQYIHVQSEIESIEAKKLGASKIAIIPNGVPILDFENEKDKCISNGIKALYLGRLDIHMKGLDKLVEEVKKNQKKLEKYNFKMELVGPILKEEDKIFIENIINKDMDLKRIIKVSEPVFGELKWNKYIESDIFILPSRSECGTPLVLLEAMMIGRPCLVVEESYSSDIVKDSRCGWVTNLEDSNLGETLISICKTSPENFIRMGKNAKRYCRMNFSWNDIVKKYLDLYNDVIKNIKK